MKHIDKWLGKIGLVRKQNHCSAIAKKDQEITAFGSLINSLGLAAKSAGVPVFMTGEISRGETFEQDVFVLGDRVEIIYPTLIGCSLKISAHSKCCSVVMPRFVERGAESLADQPE